VIVLLVVLHTMVDTWTMALLVVWHTVVVPLSDTKVVVVIALVLRVDNRYQIELHLDYSYQVALMACYSYRG
jgi:hypothetical protein